MIEGIKVLSINRLALSPEELHKLQKGRLRIIFVSDNGCEVAYVLGKPEYKAVQQSLGGVVEKPPETT